METAELDTEKRYSTVTNGSIQVACYSGTYPDNYTEIDCWNVQSKRAAYESILKSEKREQSKGSGHHNYRISDFMNRFKLIVLENKY